MSAQLSANILERFRDAIAERLGLAFGETQLGLLRAVLDQQSQHCGLSSEEYLRRLSLESAAPELLLLAEQVTVGETYFYRNIEQFHAYREVVLSAASRGRAVRILSAGCASGEEAYTLSMIARDAGVGQFVTIRAMDINPAVLERARRAHYSQWSLRETPPEPRARWFRTLGSEFVLDPEIRSSVTFTRGNLSAPDAGLFADEHYDAIFCRNVLMYFTPESMRAVVARFAKSLVPGGHLFLGHAETLRNVSHDFHLCHSHGTFYYRRKTAAEDQQEPAPVVPIAPRPESPLETTTAWVDLIGEATERVRRLSAPVEPAARPSRDLSVPLELLRKEQFSLALDAIRELPGAWLGDPDVLILEAVLLAHRGQLTEAEGVCQRLLHTDDLNAGAHYVLALCREGQGDPAGTIHHNRIASYLDSGFAMPHLHLGLLYKRLGIQDTAVHELTAARNLLLGEDPARVLLFGGGFGRSALLALCDAELKACWRTA